MNPLQKRQCAGGAPPSVYTTNSAHLAADEVVLLRTITSVPFPNPAFETIAGGGLVLEEAAGFAMLLLPLSH